MPDVFRVWGRTPIAQPHLPRTAGLSGLKHRTAAEVAREPEPPAEHRVGWGFISLYTLAFMSTSLVFIAPLLVTLALKVNSLVGIEQAPSSLSLVAGIGALLSIFANPFFGKMSDRTSSPLGMRRPWMVIGLVGGSLGILIVALAPDIAVGYCAGNCSAQVIACWSSRRRSRSRTPASVGSSMRFRSSLGSSWRSYSALRDEPRSISLKRCSRMAHCPRGTPTAEYSSENVASRQLTAPGRCPISSGRRLRPGRNGGTSSPAASSQVGNKSTSSTGASET